MASTADSRERAGLLAQLSGTIAPWLLAGGLILGHIFFAGAQPAYAMPMYGLTALAVIAAAAAVSRRSSAPSKICLAAAAVFTAYFVTRTILSPTWHLARENLFNILCAFAVYLAVALALTGPKARSVLVWAVIALIAPNVLIAAVQFFKDPFFTVLGLQRPEYGGRGSGLFICPNHLAGFLEMALPFCLSALFLSRWPVWQRLLAAYLGLVGVFGVFITGSRGGYLSAAVSLACWALIALWIRGRINPAALLKGAALLAVAVVALGFGVQQAMRQSPVLKSRFENLVNLQDFRVHIWPAAIRQFQENPVFGAGAQQFVYYGRKYRKPKIQNDPVHAHSDYLQVLADYGAVGGLLALFLLGAHTVTGLSRLGRNARERAAEDPHFRSDSVAWSAAALAGLAGIAAHSVVDFNMHIPANAWLAAFLLGILANEGLPSRHPALARRRAGRSADTPPGARGGVPFAAPALLLVGAFLLAAPLTSARAEYHREMARLGRRFGKFAEALKHGTVAAQLDPRNGHTWMILGDSKRRLAIRIEDEAVRRAIRRSAESDLRRAAALLPDDAETWRYWGRILDTLGRFDEAEKALEHARSLDPNLYLSHEFLGWHYRLMGRLEEAAAAYRRSLELYPSGISSEELAEILSERSVTP